MFKPLPTIDTLHVRFASIRSRYSTIPPTSSSAGRPPRPPQDRTHVSLAQTHSRHGCPCSAPPRQTQLNLHQKGRMSPIRTIPSPLSLSCTFNACFPEDESPKSLCLIRYSSMTIPTNFRLPLCKYFHLTNKGTAQINRLSHLIQFGIFQYLALCQINVLKPTLKCVHADTTPLQ